VGCTEIINVMVNAAMLSDYIEILSRGARATAHFSQVLNFSSSLGINQIVPHLTPLRPGTQFASVANVESMLAASPSLMH
jgi:hypothetical protein